MKMTRKILPAIVMLLVSAIMLSTASFAWFASSTSVEATNMSVKVQSAAKFMEISQTQSGTYSHSVTAANQSAVVDLVHAKIDAINKTTVTWYEGESDNPDSANAGKLTDADKLTSDDLEAKTYYLKNTFWVKMSSGSTTDLANLKISNVEVVKTIGEYTGDNLDKALRVLVVGPNGSQLWTNTTGTMALAEGASAFATTVTKTAQSFDVYVFYDGEDAVATTNKAVELKGLSVKIAFAAEMPPATP